MKRRPPRSTRTDTLFPSTTLFRSLSASVVNLPRLLNGRQLVLPQGIVAQLHPFPLELAVVLRRVLHEGVPGILQQLAACQIGVMSSLRFRRPAADRSDERRGGQAWVSTCRSRWAPAHKKK